MDVKYKIFIRASSETKPLFVFITFRSRGYIKFFYQAELLLNQPD